MHNIMLRIRICRTSKFCTESNNFKAKLNRYSIHMSGHELGVNKEVIAADPGCCVENSISARNINQHFRFSTE